MLGRYRHFKGGIYNAVCVAKHTETDELLVVYVRESDGACFCRPLEQFMSKVDTDKYPNADQEYRFMPIGR